MIWFTSDSHFGHTNIMRYCFRPFLSVEEMNETILDNINAVVHPGDTLYHLGDWSFDKTRRSNTNNAEVFRDRVNCKVILITGNHDPHYSGGQARNEFARVFNGCYDQLRIKVEGFDHNGRQREIVLNHYAMRVWNKSHHGAWHCYGHSHYTLPDDPHALSIDVGIDAVAGRATGKSWQDFNFPNLSRGTPVVSEAVSHQCDFFDLTDAERVKMALAAGLRPENYRPMSVADVAAVMSTKKFKPIDHHGDGNGHGKCTEHMRCGTDWVNELNERSKDDRAIIVGSEVRQLCQEVFELRKQLESK